MAFAVVATNARSILTGVSTPVDPIYVADFNTLRGISTNSLLAFVTGYFSDGGVSLDTAGWYQADPNDLVSVDDGLTVLVATNGMRWKRTLQLDANIATAQAAIATAAANATVAQVTIATTKAEEAADSAAAAALSEDNVALVAASAGPIFTTVALGLAGVPDGQMFNVTQSNGEGVDIWLRSGANAIWQGQRAISDLAVTGVLVQDLDGVYVPQASMVSWKTLVNNGRGCLNLSRSRSRTFGRNMYAYVNSPRSLTTTNLTQTFFNAGTNYTRAVFGLTSTLFSIWTSAYRPPAGTYTVEFALKATAADTNCRSGNATNGYVARVALAAAETIFQHQFTTDGTTYATFVITGDGTNTPDILIDKVRIIEDTAANVPLLANDPQGDDFMPTLAFRKARHTERQLTNVAASAEAAGVFRLKGYPTPVVFNEITFLVAVNSTVLAANQQLISTDADSSLGTTNTTLNISIGGADGEPDYAGITSFFGYNSTNQGPIVFALTVKDGQRSGYLRNIEMNSAQIAFTPFSARMLRLFSNSSSELSYTSTFRMQGLGQGAKVFDQYMTPDIILTEVEKFEQEIQLGGIPMPHLSFFATVMGDSQSASKTGGRGPSYGYLQSVAGTFTPNLPVRVLAVGGATSDDVKNNQLPIALAVADQCVAGRTHHLCYIFIATNNQADIIADYNNGANSFNDPNGWWQRQKTQIIAPLLAKGTKVIFATPAPDGSTGAPVGWEGARSALRTRQIADYVGSTQVFIMDFGGTAGMSTVADTLNANWDPDHRHWSTVGHTVQGPVAAAAGQLAIDSVWNDF